MKISNPVVERLTRRVKKIKSELKEKHNDFSYMNLQVTRLDRVVFNLVAQKHGLNNTKFLRKIINKLKEKNPNLVEEAKMIINEDLDLKDYK